MVEGELAFAEPGTCFAGPLTAGLLGGPVVLVGMLVLTPVTGLRGASLLGADLDGAEGPELDLTIGPFDAGVDGLGTWLTGFPVGAVIRFGASITFFSVPADLEVVIKVLEGVLLFAGA